MVHRTPRAFFLYRDSALRRAALEAPVGSAERYSLYGLDEVVAAGMEARHNLEPGREPGPGSQALGAALDRAVRLAGGYSGEFPIVLRSRRALNESDVVFSTVDTVGIPLVLLGRAALVRTPIVYAAIGLPERVAQLRTSAARRLYASAFRRLHTIVAYGAGEVDALRSWLGGSGPRVVFVPFGVDSEVFRPDSARLPDVDVVAAGSDPRRDFGLLLDVARRRPEWSFRIVASRDHASVLAGAPANVRVELDVPFAAVRERLLGARVVALPVRDNSYSGATTVLLQAMASGRPVVVSRTAAIARGYHLDDGGNCRLVEPGDAAALELALAAVLADPAWAAELGGNARETVLRHLTWDRYTGTIRDLLLAAVGGSTVSA
ncbi:MAG TPA: glycosyltransferase family 4 protein [Gaiellaceae bacterium]|nr:glycosyltransferase family 4 protein [Gaiellaceae bacterium]